MGVVQAGLLGGAHSVFGVGAGAVQALELDRVAGEVGQGGQEAVSVVVAEAQLRAGVGRSRRTITRAPSGQPVRSRPR
jgi:hypothetical protein